MIYYKSRFKRKLIRSINKIKIKIKRLFKKTNWLAHHGIERSGTNYLRSCLSFLKVDIINEVSGPENNPHHKHFRWYQDKSLIPKFRSQLLNNINACSLKDINKFCDYPNDTKHIIIKKTLIKGITSIVNYALNDNWFKNKEELKKNIPKILRDYKAYYNFWERISRENPNQVIMISYEDLVASSETLLEVLKKFGISHKVKVPKKLIFNELYQSPKNRKKYFSENELSEIISVR
jgi:hypothetical protein